MPGPWEKFQDSAPEKATTKKPWETFATTKAAPPVSDIPTLQSAAEVAKNGQMMTPESLRAGLVNNLPLIGGIGGGAIGLVGGPYGALAGAGLGGAAGQYAKQAIQAPNLMPDLDSITPSDVANNQLEAGKEPLKQGLMSAGAEGGGQIIGKGAGLIADKAAPYVEKFANARAVKSVGANAPSEIGGQLLEDGIVTPMSRPKDIVPKLDAKIAEMKAELEQMRTAPAAKPEASAPPAKKTSSWFNSLKSKKGSAPTPQSPAATTSEADTSWFNSLKSKKGAAAPAQEASDIADAEATTLEKKIADYSEALEVAKEAASKPEDQASMAAYLMHMSGQMFGNTPMEHIRNAAITSALQGAGKFGKKYGNSLMATGADATAGGLSTIGSATDAGLLNPAQQLVLKKYMDSLQGDKNAR